MNPTIPKGWRRLKDKQLINAGDRCDLYGTWRFATCIGWKVNKDCDINYIRRIKSTKTNHAQRVAKARKGFHTFLKKKHAFYIERNTAGEYTNRVIGDIWYGYCAALKIKGDINL